MPHGTLMYPNIQDGSSCVQAVMSHSK